MKSGYVLEFVWTVVCLSFAFVIGKEVIKNLYWVTRLSKISAFVISVIVGSTIFFGIYFFARTFIETREWLLVQTRI